MSVVSFEVSEYLGVKGKGLEYYRELHASLVNSHKAVEIRKVEFGLAILEDDTAVLFNF